MIIQCPHCQNSIGLKTAKPGRYATKCPKCAERFQLTIPDDPGAAPVAQPLPVEAAAGANAPAAQPSRPVIEVGTPAPSAPSGSSGTRPAGVPSYVGGCRVIRELGKGNLGNVYLAREVGFGRFVALKTIKPEWASHDLFVARFTREAYAAAQLAHHNLVSIYDFGAGRRARYISSEFVPGRTLAELVRTRAPVEPERAAVYALQAARGLRFAHEQGLVHRDVKLATLLLDEEGLVKVADLGLTKTPAMAETEAAVERGSATVAPPKGAATVANVPAGTPGFMAPEQARDATRADARADVYSLGCTLYNLLTGRPPFEGQTAVELIAKHEHEPVVPPERLAPGVPPALSAIVMRMLAKRPEERTPYMAEVVAALEGFLGVASTGVFTPRDEDARVLDDAVVRFNSAPTARLRTKVLLSVAGVFDVIVLLSLLAGQFRIAAGFLALGVLTALFTFVIGGITRGSYLFQQTRALLAEATAGDWLTIGAGLVVLLGAIVVFKMIWPMVAFAIVAGLISWGVHTSLDRRADEEQREPLEQARRLVRDLRLRGLDEDTIRQFVCKYAGDHWETLYEALFGYEAKLIARARWKRDEHVRALRRAASWRGPLLRALDTRLQSHRAARHQRLLQHVEEKGFEAQGINLLTARRRSRRIAAAMVAAATEFRAAARDAVLHGGTPLAIGPALREAAERPDDVLGEQEAGVAREPRFEGLLNLVLGGRTRFLAGAALVAGCLLWMQQNRILDTAQIKATAAELQKAAQQARESNDVGPVLDVKVDAAKHVHTEAIRGAHEPLKFPGVPGSVRRLFNSFNPGVAGLILVISSFFAGWRMALFAVPGAALTLLGASSSDPLGVTNLVTMAVGGAILVAGMFFGRTR